MNFQIVPFEAGQALLSWHDLIVAIEEGHNLSKAEIGDTFLYRKPDTLLSRSAWIDGLGIAVKSATIFPENAKRNKLTVNGGLCLYSDDDGTLEALVDFHLVTKWKTAGDSVLAASKLARKNPEKILIVGAGTVAHSLAEAYGALFPDARFEVWNRTPASAEKLAASYNNVTVCSDLESAVRGADIVTCATMSTTAIIKGEWLQPGQHIDLIGAYRADMREVDDDALRCAKIFVDSRDTTLDHIGELKIPLAAGVIKIQDICADYYDLPSGAFARTAANEITLFKNGGGAHLDLMTSRYILDAWRNR